MDEGLVVAEVRQAITSRAPLRHRDRFCFLRRRSCSYKITGEIHTASVIAAEMRCVEMRACDDNCGLPKLHAKNLAR